MYRTGTCRISVLTIALVLIALMLIPAAQASNDTPTQANSIDKSDLNYDRVIDTADLLIFSAKYLLVDAAEFDWCGFHDATIEGVNYAGTAKKDKLIKDKPAAYYNKHYGLLLEFINQNFACEVVPLPECLALDNYPRLLLRMAMSTDGSGDVYITDPRVGSVYFYDEGLLPRAELKGLNRPLGIAVDTHGHMLVGNDGRDNVEVYDLATGEMVATFGQERVIMPNALSVGPDGNIFVTDSRSHRVWVYDSDYQYIGSIGSPGFAADELFFPVDTEIMERYVDGVFVKEVFVADQGNERIQVYAMDGHLLRTIYPGECVMGTCLPPRLANLQALDTDNLGRLHALDNFEAVVSILDPATGDYLGEYGQYGVGPGFLWVPFGLVIHDSGASVVTSGQGIRLEVYPPQ